MTCRNICVFSSGGDELVTENGTLNNAYFCVSSETAWHRSKLIKTRKFVVLASSPSFAEFFLWLKVLLGWHQPTRAASCLSGMRSMRGQSIWLNEVCKNKSSHDVSLISCAHQEGWRKWLFHQLTLTDRLWCCCHNVAVPIKIKIPINLTFEMCNPPWKGHPSCSFLEQGKGC